jgi:hypothetical protein
MAEYKQVGSGFLSDNNYKMKDSHPDKTGKLEIDGVEVQLSVWTDQTSKSGGTYDSVKASIRLDESVASNSQPADDIGF